MTKNLCPVHDGFQGPSRPPLSRCTCDISENTCQECGGTGFVVRRAPVTEERYSTACRRCGLSNEDEGGDARVVDS